ncbi:SH3 domain-containing protein [Jannaschia sp. 2305UL9-9]|uniref:SH3 domain-containing protein n=1 Tax=Jannaschia sp. 2305UL9-9 TaxID=3121638 RepID=UPI003527B0E7
MRSYVIVAVLTACLMLLAPGPVFAAERGPVTNLPLPRFVSMKASEGYARRGPSSTHRIDWVFKRRHMPLQIVAEYGHWRRVQDREGAGGWMHYSLLSGNRTVVVTQPEVVLYRRPSPDAAMSARLQAGVVAWLNECAEGWCRLEVEGADGWAPIPALWGVAPDETRD